MNPLIDEIIQLLRTANLGLLRKALEVVAKHQIGVPWLISFKGILENAQPKQKPLN